MPVISKIRFTNVIYENGNKRYQDEIFHFDGQNSVLLLENGGGKTVWVQTALQAILPHTDVAGRKAFETFLLSEGCAHIAIEWVVNQKARRYLVTAVSLYEQSQKLQSYRYAYEYGVDDRDNIEGIPYVEALEGGGKRPVGRSEIQEYYLTMEKNKLKAHTFQTIEKYHDHLAGYGIIAAEWKKIAQINSAEGGVGKFFENCTSTPALVERLLIPIVEDAISGDGTKNFVEAFEKQREHIKRYKQLKHQIEECEDILGQVKGFTSNFEAWDAEEKAFNTLKGKAKAVFYLIQKDHQDKLALQESQEASQLTIKKAIESLEHKEASYALQLTEKAVEEKAGHYKEALEAFEKLDRALKQTDHRRASLEYAQTKQKITDSHKEEEGVRQAIKRLSQDSAVAEIEESLEENSQYLSGYFKNALEELGKDIQQLQNEIRTDKESVEKDKQEKVLLDQDKQAYEERKTEKDVTIKLVKEEIKSLEQSLLDRPDQEKVEDKKLDIQKRLGEIEGQIHQGYTHQKDLETEYQGLNQEEHLLIEDLDEEKDHNRENQNKLDNLEERHKKVLEKIHAASYKLEHVDSVYESHFILSSMERDIEKNRLALDQAKQEERISLRWLDDYQDGDYFIADPRILSRLEEWKKEFDRLSTGAEFIKGKERGNFPYWAITLITSDKEKDKLRQYVEENKDFMTHPIWVTTEFEAHHYLKEGPVSSHEFIFPGPWESNIDKGQFQAWKQDLREKADTHAKTRQTIQATYNMWQGLKKAILSFQEDYPQALFRTLTGQGIAYKEAIKAKENALKLVQARAKEIISHQAKLIEDRSQLAEERHTLQGQMEKILSHEAYTREIEENKKELREIIKPKLRLLTPQIRALERNIQDLSDRISDLKDDLREKERAKDQVQTDPLYRATKNTSHLNSSYSLEALKAQREDLEKELGQEQKGRRDLEAQLSKITKDREAETSRLNNHLMQYPNIDQSIRFITAYEEEIKTLIEKKINLASKMTPLREAKDSLKTSYDRLIGQYHNQKELFHKQYPALFKWEEPLSTAKLNLEKERQDLTGKLAYIEEQISRVTKELEETSKAKYTLEKKNEAFKYLIDGIKVADLKEEEQLDFLYQKDKQIGQMIQGLEKKQEAVAKKLDSLQKEKQSFTDFCQRNIRNMKLRELTLKGVQSLTTYQAVTQWENNLYNRIMKTRKIAEDDIKTHAEELDLFIQMVHSYVKQVADGLGEIHRKTRVKIDDKWKDVYTIKVPEWDKLTGQEEIQTYILWIIDQLESGQYPEETHRREIEKWLSVKQLLGIVTQNRPITVKCRKLTNQNTLAPVSSSWSQSNKWSGGEKWSKNMILFLGLLNFLAEKTGHVIEGQKRNRTVILDNPFGQASSDHVLSPVFFVAEQLGFQIITLTALAEGPFIRKYFPVVYSCRLRTATDGTQIMAKEQRIQQALFKDDELPSIGRLETKEQMSLLGD